MTQNVINLDGAGHYLARLTRRLDETTDIKDLNSIRQQTDSIEHMLKVAHFAQEWQDKFFAIRARAMRRMGMILKDRLGHGRPKESVDDEDTFPTLDELGISRNMSSDCQAMAIIREDIFEKYLTGNDKLQEGLTKKRLFEWCAWEDYRVYQKPENDRRAAEERQREREQIIRDATAEESEPATSDEAEGDTNAGDTAEDADADADANAEEEEPEPPPRRPDEDKLADKVLGAMRIIVDPKSNPNEADVALNTVRKLDLRLESVTRNRGGGYDYALRSSEYAEYWRSEYAKQCNRATNYQDQVRDLQKEIADLKRLQRKHLDTIRDLNEQNERLRAEVEALRQGTEHVDA